MSPSNGSKLSVTVTQAILSVMGIISDGDNVVLPSWLMLWANKDLRRLLFGRLRWVLHLVRDAIGAGSSNDAGRPAAGASTKGTAAAAARAGMITDFIFIVLFVC
jgi:hypothetical protein